MLLSQLTMSLIKLTTKHKPPLLHYLFKISFGDIFIVRALKEGSKFNRLNVKKTIISNKTKSASLQASNVCELPVVAELVERMKYLFTDCQLY